MGEILPRAQTDHGAIAFERMEVAEKLFDRSEVGLRVVDRGFERNERFPDGGQLLIAFGVEIVEKLTPEARCRRLTHYAAAFTSADAMLSEASVAVKSVAQTGLTRYSLAPSSRLSCTSAAWSDPLRITT